MMYRMFPVMTLALAMFVGGPLLAAEDVKIKDSTLKSDIVVFAKNLVEVTIENSTLEGKDVGLKLDNNSKVSLTKGSVLKSPQLAVISAGEREVGTNARYSGTTGGAWTTPTSTLVGRLVKFSTQVNF